MEIRRCVKIAAHVRAMKWEHNIPMEPPIVIVHYAVLTCGHSRPIGEETKNQILSEAATGDFVSFDCLEC